MAAPLAPAPGGGCVRRCPTAGAWAGRRAPAASCRRRGTSTVRCWSGRPGSRCARCRGRSAGRAAVPRRPVPRGRRPRPGDGRRARGRPPCPRASSPRSWARCSPRRAGGRSTRRRGRWAGGTPTTSRAGDRGAPSTWTGWACGGTTSGGATGRTGFPDAPEAPDTHVAVPVHPFQREQVLPAVFARELADGVVVPLARGVGRGRATASLRTLDLGGRTHLKLPLGVTTLGSARLLGARSLDYGQRGERVLRGRWTPTPPSPRGSPSPTSRVGRVRAARRERRVRRPPRAPGGGAASATSCPRCTGCLWPRSPRPLGTARWPRSATRRRCSRR